MQHFRGKLKPVSGADRPLRDPPGSRGNPPGSVAFFLGGGSSYEWTLGASPNDRFYVGTEFRDRNQNQPPAPPISDTFYYGLPDHRHLDTTYTVRLMTA